MNNVYTAPHAPKPTEPAATSPVTQKSALPSAVAASPVAPSTSTQPTESRRSLDQRPESAHTQSLAVQPAVNTTTSSSTDRPLSANTTSPTSRTEDTSEKKHDLAAVAASAASAIGIHKGSHQGTSTASQQTGDVPPSARSGVTTAQTGDHAPASATHAPASSSTSTGESKVEQVKTKAEQLVASAVPGSSTGSKHVDSTSGSQRVESASAPVAREAGVQHATTGLAGLNLGAPIGGAQSTTYNSSEFRRCLAICSLTDFTCFSSHHDDNLVHQCVQLVLPDSRQAQDVHRRAQVDPRFHVRGDRRRAQDGRTQDGDPPADCRRPRCGAYRWLRLEAYHLGDRCRAQGRRTANGHSSAVR